MAFGRGRRLKSDGLVSLAREEEKKGSRGKKKRSAGRKATEKIGRREESETQHYFQHHHGGDWPKSPGRVEAGSRCNGKKPSGTRAGRE